MARVVIVFFIWGGGRGQPVLLSKHTHTRAKQQQAHWMDLTEEGYLANVQCVEAWCPMTKEFFQVR